MKHTRATKEVYTICQVELLKMAIRHNESIVMYNNMFLEDNNSQGFVGDTVS
jgi:hypothetical protein